MFRTACIRLSIACLILSSLAAGAIAQGVLVDVRSEAQVRLPRPIPPIPRPIPPRPIPHPIPEPVHSRYKIDSLEVNAKVAEQANQAEINKITLASEGPKLIDVAKDLGGDLGAKALHQAFIIAKDRRNLSDMLSSGNDLLANHSNTKYAKEVLPALAEQYLRVSQMEEAARRYEEYARKYPEGEAADDLLEWLRVLWITPAMDALFTGPAGDRRRFLDRLVLAIDPGHGRRALDYEKAMRGRNRLLADGSRDQAWFDAIELQMVEAGTAIAAARAEMVRLLAAMMRVVYLLSAAMPGVMPRLEWARQESGVLSLKIPPSLAGLYGERLEGRLAQLAKISGRKLEFLLTG